jgi:TPR repeat protein
MRTRIVLACVLVGGCPSLPSSAGWQEGREAFDRGDYATALNEFHPLAEQGNRNAQALLGYIYDNGVKNGVSRNPQTAYKWYRMAAENGEAQSQIALGRMYWEGRDIPQDYGAALRMFEMAAAQGASGGQTGLGTMYLNGYGVDKDYEAARKWFKLAADQGNGFAQLQLGHIYYEGTGVSQDFVQAYMWFSLAATKGAKGATFLRDYMAKSMTAAQIDEARRLAHEWKPKTDDEK